MVKNVVILTGPRAAYGFCTVPPLTDSAPERNLYRLTEQDYRDDLQVHVISACSQSQLPHLQSKNYIGHYHWITFPDSALSYHQSKLLHNRLISGASNHLLHVPDLFTYLYLRQACEIIKTLYPDLILINSLPQYIRYIRDRFPGKKLGLFVRGEIGDSRKYLPYLDLIITNSTGISNYVRTLLKGTFVLIEKIPNTLEHDYCTQKKEYSLKPRRIIYTGRIEPDKGVMELIKAFGFVQRKFPEACLSIVGGNFGNISLTDYEHALLSEALGKNLNVEFIGQVPNQDLPALYQTADIAVFPSICLESFGMVALEAMRCGLPVVASRRPGFEELIIEGETGLIINNPCDIQELANAINGLFNDPQIIISMGKKGYEKSLTYIPETAAALFQKILTDMVTGKNG